VEKARQVHGQHSREVGVGVLDERLGNEDAGVVDQGVDATEAIDRRAHDALGGLPVGHVAGERQHIRRPSGVRFDRPGIGHDAIAAPEEPVDQPRTDPLRRPGNQGDSLFAAHDAALRMGSGVWLLGAVFALRDGRCNALGPCHRAAEAGRRAVIDADPPRSRAMVRRSPSGFLAEIAAG
jgi:hypothetical protein